MSAVDEALDSMRVYYAKRATYYERVYQKPERQTDLRAMEAWLASRMAGERVLELACGTGWWTPHGARDCAHWLATDVSPETMAVAQAKALPAAKVEFATLDAYTLDGLDARRFSSAFAGCWWSHVPLRRLRPWLERLHDRLGAGARIVMLDNSHVQASNLPITRRDVDGNTYQQRTLDDGSEHEVLKNFPTRDEAFAAIGVRAVDREWIAFDHYWVLSYRLT